MRGFGVKQPGVTTLCGIFGYVLSDTIPGRRPSIDRALEALRHRGPDGSGYWVDDVTDPVCALAHTRLAIIDLSPGGAQPMTTPDGILSITFNGEIYNYRDVRTELEALGTSFVSESDTEVLLLGFRRWGADLLPRLRGMFAFAVWDSEQRSLFLARDRMGVKPLYYARVSKGIVFASELRAVLETGLVPRQLSTSGLSDYIAFGSVREPRTIIDGISMLPSGAYAYLKNGTWRETAYWAPPVRVDRRISRPDAVAELGMLVRESVALRLVSDVPVGVFLSGGLDSSAIVALAAAASRAPIHTFTVTFDEAAYNEARRAQATAERYGAVHHPIRLSAQHALQEMGHALDALDQPSADGMNTYFVSKSVRDAGVSVALSGIGGDELFAGYPNFRRFKAAARLAPVLRHLPWGVHDGTLPGANRSVRKMLSLLGTRGEPFAMYVAFRSMLSPEQGRRLLSRSERMQPKPTPLDASIAKWASGPDGDTVSAYGMFEATNYLRNTLLRDTDAMGMAHALEIREPLLDHKLVERALTLPGSMKLARTRNKPLLADAVPDLPSSTATGPKMGFTLPFETWLRGPMRGWAEDRLREGRILKSTEVHRLWTGFEQGRVSYARIWTLLALMAWTGKHNVNAGLLAE